MNPLSRRNFLASALAAPQLERRAPGRKVVVAGGGLAGLSAALELLRSGQDVTLFEAQTRAGGRVQTLREPFSDGLHAEAGAVRIADDHSDVLALCQEFGLELEPYIPEGLDPVYVISGQRLVERDAKAPPFPVALRDDERGMTVAQLWEKYAGPWMRPWARSSRSAWPPEGWRVSDQLTARLFWLKMGASPGAADLLLLSSDREHQSALAMLCEEAALATARRWLRIKGGNDRLPRAMARRLAPRVRYGCPVVEIHPQEDSVEIVFLEGGLPQKLKADFLVCAVPLPLVGRIRIQPAFAADKMELITRLRMKAASRLFFQSRERFWLKEKLSGLAWIDRPALRAGPGAPAGDTERGVLFADALGRTAHAFDAMTPPVRLEAALAGLERAFPPLRRQVEGAAYKSWMEDEWQRGAFVEHLPGEAARAHAILSRMEGRVAFAGDYTGTWGPWLQGAVESGLRAAREVSARPWQAAPETGSVK